MHRAHKKWNDLIASAVAKRRALFHGRTIDAYRLLDEADGVPTEIAPEIAVDRYRDWIVVRANVSVRQDAIDEIAQAVREILKPKGAVLKRLAKRPTDSTSSVLFGDIPNGPIEVREEDATFLVDLNDGVQTGLFLDHRETRLAIRDDAKGADVLNLFAYTCAFSVHAALGGAGRVTSVDVSKKALERGRANMRASGLDPAAHRWFADDAFDHIRKDRAYDLIILDPPVFGRSKKRTFSLESSVDELLRGAVANLTPGGLLVFSTHATALAEADLSAKLERAGAAVERTAGAAADFPASDYLKTLFARKPRK